MHTNESAENYLETILILSESRPVVRSVDIAAELDYKKSSVSVAMKKLRENNHITVTPEGFIYLTESGKEIADRIYERHKLLSSWLEQLGVDPEVAVADACRIEHVISAESFEAIKGTQPLSSELPEGCLFSDRCPICTEECRRARPQYRSIRGGKVRCIHAA